MQGGRLATSQANDGQMLGPGQHSRKFEIMSAVLFSVSKWPSKDELLDALKYGDDPRRKFRVKFTVYKSAKEEELDDVQVTGYKNIHTIGPSWVELTLFLHKPFNYHGHHFKTGETMCWVNVENRRQTGTIHLMTD